VPFREAHEIVGHLVVWCQVNDVALDEVSDEDLVKVSPYLTPDVRAVLTVEGALAARKGFGGTAPDRVAEQLVALRTTVDDGAAWAAAGARNPSPPVIVPRVPLGRLQPAQRHTAKVGHAVDLIARDFFDRPADEVAPALLGCVLEHETDEGLVAVELTEVEAYAGRPTPRLMRTEA